jgi:hypothetical protein
MRAKASRHHYNRRGIWKIAATWLQAQSPTPHSLQLYGSYMYVFGRKVHHSDGADVVIPKGSSVIKNDLIHSRST